MLTAYTPCPADAARLLEACLAAGQGEGDQGNASTFALRTGEVVVACVLTRDGSHHVGVCREEALTPWLGAVLGGVVGQALFAASCPALPPASPPGAQALADAARVTLAVLSGDDVGAEGFAALARYCHAAQVPLPPFEEASR